MQKQNNNRNSNKTVYYDNSALIQRSCKQWTVPGNITIDPLQSQTTRLAGPLQASHAWTHSACAISQVNLIPLKCLVLVRFVRPGSSRSAVAVHFYPERIHKMKATKWPLFISVSAHQRTRSASAICCIRRGACVRPISPRPIWLILQIVLLLEIL